MEAGLHNVVEDACSKRDEAVSSVPAREQTSLEAEKELETKKAETHRFKIALAETAEAFKRAKKAVTEAEEANLAHSRTSDKAAEKKGHCEAALADLTVLKTAAPEDDASRVKLEKLIGLLKEYKFDESMMIAVPAALAKAPDTRGEFDHMAVEQLDVEIGKMIESQEKILAAAKPGEEQCEAACKQASDVLSEAKGEQKVAASNYIAGSKQQAACAEALTAAKSAVQELSKSVAQFNKAVEQAEIEVELFQQGPKQTFNALRSRAAPEPVSIEAVPAPPPAEEQALESRESEVAAVAAC
jgi:ElaB/YqjD/DUF883 family membrane-anchored ribosome-binding protein